MSTTGFDTVFDLPQLYSHPSAEELISTLDYLALEPPSWDHQSRSSEPQGGRNFKITEVGMPNYLTSIVASPLSWIHEDRREEIWEAASKRLSERSGRAGEWLVCALQQEMLLLVIALKMDSSYSVRLADLCDPGPVFEIFHLDFSS